VSNGITDGRDPAGRDPRTPRAPAPGPQGQAPEGCIFEIRRYALHDGPGLRTTVFLKGCPLTCRWCCNPESQGFNPELTWAAESCLRCDLCQAACSQGALATDREGARTLERGRCQRCGTCAARCPGGALHLLGRRVTVDEVLAEVGRDALYFEASGGGLTLSGGEPLAQPEFAAELLRRYKREEKGRSTAMETSGHAAWSAIEKLAADVDLFLYDLKHMDAAEHLRLTGQGNELVLKNARRLAAAGGPVVFRLPLVPGMNDGRANLEATAEFVLSLPGVNRIEVLPYHRLGEAKYRRLGRPYGLERVPSPTGTQVEAVRRTLARPGLDVRVGG